jgi:hypothetical protein
MYLLSNSYGLVALPHLTAAVNLTACSFGQPASSYSTPVFYRHTVQNILTESSAAYKMLTFSKHTYNTAC